MKRVRMTAEEFRAYMALPVRRHKYAAEAIEVDGHRFASKAEAARYGELLLMEKAGEIRDLVLQPRYVLQEAFRDSQGVCHRAITYVADFAYYDPARGRTVVEDVKGVETAVFKIKLRLFRKRYPEYHFRKVLKAGDRSATGR